MIDDVEFSILNAIYLKKMVAPETVVQVVDLPPDRVSGVVASATEKGLVLAMGDQVMLDSPGSAAVLEYYRRTYGSLAADPELVAFYERFEQINSTFIKLVSDWQTTAGDERAKERILRLVERHIKALDDIAARIPRYALYARRFERTIGLVDAGERDLVSNPRRDSLHNIWFEFHEDVLAVMGRPRES